MSRIGRRPVKPIDGLMLRALFAESRDDLAALPADVRDVLLDLQYRAQFRNWTAQYPNAHRELLLVDDEPVGYLVLDLTGSPVRVVDMCITSRECGVGIAMRVVQDLIAEAGERSVRLAIREADVTSRRNYEALGFTLCGPATGEPGHFEFEHLALASTQVRTPLAS